MLWAELRISLVASGAPVEAILCMSVKETLPCVVAYIFILQKECTIEKFCIHVSVCV